MFVVLFFLFITVSLQAMEISEKTALLKTYNINVFKNKKRKYENRFQSLPPDVKKEILNVLVSLKNKKEGALGLFSLARTSKENKKLVDDFCEQSNEAQLLKIKYLKVNDKNVGNLWNFARKLNNDEKMQEYEHFIEKGIEPNFRENLCDWFLCLNYTCCFSVENDFKERIKKKYALDEDSVSESFQGFNFEFYKKRRKKVQTLACLTLVCLCFCCPCTILSGELCSDI